MSNEPPKDDITIEEFLKHLEQLVTGKPEGSSDESKASNSSGSSANLKDLLAEFRLKDKEFVDLLNKKLKDYEEIRPALNALADEFSKIITSSLGSDAEEPKVEAEKSDTFVPQFIFGDELAKLRDQRAKEEAKNQEVVRQAVEAKLQAQREAVEACNGGAGVDEGSESAQTEPDNDEAVESEVEYKRDDTAILVPIDEEKYPPERLFSDDDPFSENEDEKRETLDLTKVMTPGQVVEALDRYIVGQDKAKRAVAIALRNRYRREKLGAEMREEIIPKNILMVGPTGVGKTEIARRLAKLVGAPFMKVEATKYTEVGYVGRDVESMIRELAIVGARMVERENMIKVRKEARRAAIERLLDAMQGREEDEERDSGALGSLFGGWGSRKSGKKEKNTHPHEETYERSLLRRELFGGKLDDKIITLNLEDEHSQEIQVMAGGIDEVGVNIQDVFGGILPKKRTKHKLSIRRAFQVLVLEESKKMIDPEEVKRAAVDLVENQGILFLDELDKVAGKEGGHGPDVSREGVQRDILPIVEGCSVNTKIGQVRTDHILFIAAGAFHETKPSDLIPELQGRFPIRVALESLKEEDFKRILTEPENSLTRQYRELLATEGVEVEFSDDGLAELASMACQVNEQTENIGARRLHTMLERVLERISFEAPEMKGQKVVIDREYVLNELKDICASRDLSRFIL